MIVPHSFSFDTLVRFVDKFFRAIGVVISRLSLQPLLSVGVLWLTAAAFLPDEKMTVGLIVFFVVLASVALGYAIAATVYNFAKYVQTPKTPKRPPVKERVQTVEQETNAEYFKAPEPSAVKAEQSVKPLYFRVAQNPKYVMAEYPDRYELYYDDGGTLKFVKANVKKEGQNL